MSIPYQGLAEPTIRFCEANTGTWIMQPANAVSSLVISMAGFYILRKNQHPYAKWLGWTAVTVGLASFLYHASCTFIGQLFDLGSMFLIASYLIAVALRSVVQRRMAIMVLLLGTLIPLLLTAIFKTVGGLNVGIPFFILLLLSAIALEVQTAGKEKTDQRIYWWAFVAFMGGWVVWLLDYAKVWCDPHTFHLINGHAIWHIGSAVALLLLNRYYAQLGPLKEKPIVT